MFSSLSLHVRLSRELGEDLNHFVFAHSFDIALSLLYRGRACLKDRWAGGFVDADDVYRIFSGLGDSSHEWHVDCHLWTMCYRQNAMKWSDRRWRDAAHNLGFLGVG